MKKKRRRTKRQAQKRKLIIAIVVTLLALVLTVVAYILSKYSKINRIAVNEENIRVNELSKETMQAMENYTTIALFGLDNRSNGNFKSGNSDTIIVVSINDDTGEVKMASVYRDTYLDISEDKFRKANAAYNQGGPQQAISMLNKNLDLNITDYVAVDFNAVVKGVDLLGGVELDITSEEVKYMNRYIDEVSKVSGTQSSHVSAGTQLCDGVQATAYARIRYTEGWDYKRTERQRTVITKMFEKAKKTDIFTLNNMMDEILPKVSTSLSATELLDLISNIGKYQMGENTGFPFDKTNADVGKVTDAVVPVDLEANVVQLHQFLYSNEDYTPSETVQKISRTIHSNTGY